MPDEQHEVTVMLQSFSESARQVIFIARVEAGRLQFESIDLQHLLLGFIIEDRGEATRHFRKTFSADEPQWLDRAIPPSHHPFLDHETAAKLQAAFSDTGERPEPQPMHGDMPITEAVNNVLSAAFEHAHGSTVTPLHLLWAMFTDGDHPVARGLIENGVTRQKVENAIPPR